eukprot:3777235-Rhodomonas_salina.1
MAMTTVHSRPALRQQRECASDLHQYDIPSRVWTDLSSPSAGTTPSARAGMGFAAWNSKLYIFGGVRRNT